MHRITGEIRILHSVHAADAGVVINPAQVRGQIEGGVAQAIGFALIENFHVDDHGVMVNPNLRNYRIPTYGGEYVSLPACSVANQPSSRLSRWTGTAANGKRAQLLPRTAWLATFSSVVRRKGRLCRVIGDRS